MERAYLELQQPQLQSHSRQLVLFRASRCRGTNPVRAHFVVMHRCSGKINLASTTIHRERRGCMNRGFFGPVLSSYHALALALARPRCMLAPTPRSLTGSFRSTLVDAGCMLAR